MKKNKFIVLLLALFLVGCGNNQITPEPTQQPTVEPTVEPTPVPTVEPTPVPTIEPTPVPTVEPTPIPTVEPTPVPTVEPTPVPTVEPTPVPTVEPTPVPTPEPITDPYEGFWTYEGDYYTSLDLTLTGNDLKSSLSKIINNGAKNSSYSGLRSAYKYTDVDPENENNIILYYTGESRAFAYGQSTAFQGSINREHVWPQSRYASLGKKQPNTPYDDVFNVRPSDKDYNSSRGNGLFDYGLNEPELDSYKGDVARALMYVATRWTGLSLVDNTTGGDNSMGKLSTLLEWNLKYPVTDVEIRRNNGGQQVQNNRNPFIDNPGFGCAIWGNTNENTKKVCSASYEEVVASTNNENYTSYLSSYTNMDLYYDPSQNKKY